MQGQASNLSLFFILADKCCNVRDLAGSPPKDRPLERRHEYLLWTEQAINGL